MKILLVEDSERLCRAVGTGLRKAGFAVDIASDGEEGLHLAQCGDYDVIVLDLMLPKLDGLSLLRTLRGAGKDTHVLILTARDAVEDRVKGLRAGADDYLTKPFDFDELLARIEALVRRRYGRKDPTIRIGDIELNTATRTVGRNGRTVDLAPREYALLEYLAVRAGELVTRTEIEEHIYDDIVSPMSNVVDSAICNLRKKLTISGSDDPIRTRRGMGYVLEAPE
jgi:DNA-binding response OmpR family regulator